MDLSTYQVGPYPVYETSELAERIIDSKEHFTNLELLCQGAISLKEFVLRLIYITESLHADFVEREKEARGYR